MKPLTLEAASEVANITTMKVVFPALGRFVVVKKLDLDELAKVQGITAGCADDDKDANREAEVMVCALAIIDEAGKQVYDTNEGLDALRKLPDPMRQKISNAALGLLGLDGIALKNS